MFKVTRVDENRLDIEMSGKLDSTNMEKALDELVEKSEGIENGKMLYDVVEYHLPSLGGDRPGVLTPPFHVSPDEQI